MVLRDAIESRSGKSQATVYQKHRSMRTQKVEVYGLTPAQCRKVKGSGESYELKPR